MDLDIRKAVLKNFNKASYDDIENTINDAINKADEVTLPGLGVLFELLWQNANEQWKDDCTQKLATYLD